MDGYTEVFAWGGDSCGQLGLGGKQGNKTYCNPRFCSFNIIIRSLGCGEEHTAFIAENGYVYTMGSNADGRLGIGDSSIRQSFSPCLVEALANQRAIDVHCGWGHTAVIVEDGSVYTWGLGEFGALGNGSTTSQWTPDKLKLPRNQRAIQVSCGSRHTAVIANSKTSKGKLYMCGAGESGQLGTGRTGKELNPVHVTVADELKSVACGVLHSVLLTTSGKLLITGGNSCGQLGLGNKKSVSVPTAVSALEAVTIAKVKCGSYTAAICERGCLYLWGTGVFGELLSPIRVSSIGVQLKTLDVGTNFGAAVDIEGGVWTWGSNSSGELGVGDFEPRVNPFQVRTLQGKHVKAISCGSTFTIALGANIDRSSIPTRQGMSSDRGSLPLKSPRVQRSKRALSPYNRRTTSPLQLPITPTTRSDMPSSTKRKYATPRSTKGRGLTEITQVLESMQCQQDQMRTEIRLEKENRRLLELELHAMKRPEPKVKEHPASARDVDLDNSLIIRGNYAELTPKASDQTAHIAKLTAQLIELDKQVRSERDKARHLESARHLETQSLEANLRNMTESLKAEKELRIRAVEELQLIENRGKEAASLHRAQLKKKDDELNTLRLEFNSLKRAVDSGHFKGQLPKDSHVDKEELDFLEMKLNRMEKDYESASVARLRLEEEVAALRQALQASRQEAESLRRQLQTPTDLSHFHTNCSSAIGQPLDIEQRATEADLQSQDAFKALEKSLMVKAREYKQRTLNVLATPSPLRGSRSASPENSFNISPVPARHTRYKLDLCLSARESKENSPYRRHTLMRNSRSATDMSDLVSQESPIHSYVSTPRLTELQSQQKSDDEATPPTFRGQESNGFKNSLSDIGAKLALLKQNKTALEGRIQDFDSKLRIPRQL